MYACKLKNILTDFFMEYIEEHHELRNFATATNDSLLRTDQAIDELRNKSEHIGEETITLKQNMGQITGKGLFNVLIVLKS